MKASNDGEQLLAMVCERPSDIEPRVVYGDWLASQDDPRGPFIVEQCRLASMEPLEPEYPALLSSTRARLGTHGPEWLARLGLPEMTPEDSTRNELDHLRNADFRCGFISRLALWMGEFTKHWQTLRQREPVEGVELLVGMLTSEQRPESVEGVRRLKLSPEDWITAHSVAELLCWGLEPLTELDLSRCDVGADGVRLLIGAKTKHDYEIAAPPLPRDQLRYLILHSTKLGDEGADVLLRSELVSQLVELDVSQCGIDSTDTLALFKAAPWERLRSLSLIGNRGLGDHLGQLAGWELLPKLEQLALPQSTTQAALEALFPVPSPALRRLNLASAKPLLGTAGITRVAEALTHLNIGTTRCGDKVFKQLVQAESLQHLVDLRCQGCSLSDAGLLALLESDLDCLVELDISSNKLTDKGFQALAQWPALNRVSFLRVGNNRKVTARGYGALLESPHFAPAAFHVGSLSNREILDPLEQRLGHRLIRS